MSVASEAFVASSVSPVASSVLSVLSVLSAGLDAALSAFVATVVPTDPGCA